MRKLIISNAMSLDGYYEGPGKNVMALFDYRWVYPTDESFDAYNAERLRAADTLLLGRVSYDGFKSFWPSVADDPNATPLQREISRLDNAIEKVVISDTLTSGETDPWHNTASSAAQTPTSGSPNSKAKRARTSWYLVAEHSGSTDNLTNTLIIRIRADHREITLV